MRNMVIVAVMGLLSAVLYAREPNPELVAQNQPTAAVVPTPNQVPAVPSYSPPPRVMPGQAQAPTAVPYVYPSGEGARPGPPPPGVIPYVPTPPPGVIPNQPAMGSVPVGGPTINPPTQIRPTVQPPMITGPPGSQNH